MLCSEAIKKVVIIIRILTWLRILLFPRPRNGSLFPPSETLIKLLVLYLGIVGLRVRSLGDAHHGTHMTIAFFFSLHCCFEILYHYGAHFIIPKGIDYLCVALGFSVEAFLFSWRDMVRHFATSYYCRYCSHSLPD